MKYVDEKGLAYVLSRVKQENAELKNENTELKAECERLREDANSAPCVSSEGENVTLEGTAEARFKEFKICGNSKQEVRDGYNLLPNKTSEELTINGVKFSIHEDGTVTVNGTATANAILNLLDSKTLDLAEGSYFLSGCPVGGSTSKYKFDMIEGMAGNPIAEDYGNGATLTLTESKSIQQARIVIYGGATVNNLLFKPMICVEQKTYEQYGASPSVDFPSEIKTVKDSADVTICNKNLLNTKLANSKVANGVRFTINEDGSILIEGTAEKYTTLFIEHKMTLKANQTYKAVAFGNKNIASSLYFITTDNKYMGVNLKKDSVFDKDIEIAKFYIAVNEGVTIDETVYLMLCNDTTDSDYVQHKEQSFTIAVQQEFRKNSDIADGFKKINGVWHERHWIGRYVVTGDENWLLESNGTRLGLYGLITKSDNTARQHSNMFKNCVRWGASNTNTFFVENDNIRFHNDFGFETVEEAKAHLKSLYETGNPLYFDYVMTESFDIECTAEQKSILNEIEKTAKSYKDVTHIYSTDEISPIFAVEARKDMQLENDKINARIDEIEALLSTTATSALLLDNFENDLESEVM